MAKLIRGYLSEVSLTSHLSSLTMAENEPSKNPAEVEVERTSDIISNTNLTTVDHQLPLKQTLAVVRNASQAVASIQSAFRAHSFRMRQAASTSATDTGDAYNFLSHDVYGLSAASKLAFRNTRDNNVVALSIQKKYHGWKGRKDFLAYCKKVVKIQCYAERQVVSAELLDTQVNHAVWEISGHMVLKRKEEASQEKAWRLLAEVFLSEERFKEVKDIAKNIAMTQGGYT